MFVTSEATFIDMAAWDACVDPAATPAVSDKELPIYVGVDASVKHDSTAIVAVTWDKEAQKVRLVFHRVFQPSPTEPLDFEAAIENTITDLAQRFRVRKVLFDPFQMAATSQRLARQGIQIDEFPQSTPNLTAASQNLYELINGHNLIAYHDAAIRLSVSRAIAIESPRGWRITKEKQSHKIDDTIRAWAVGSLSSYTFADIGWTPRLGFQFDAASGDSNPHDNVLQTFNPLFPNGYYFTLAGYTGYTNLIDRFQCSRSGSSLRDRRRSRRSWRRNARQCCNWCLEQCCSLPSR